MPRGAKTSSLRIQWVRSAIGYSSQQGKVIQGLGFRRLRQVVERPDTPQIRSMIIKVGHLVEIVPPAAADPFAAVPEYTVLPRGKARTKAAAKPPAKQTPAEPKKAPAQAAVAAEKKAPEKKAAATAKPKKAESPKRAAKPVKKAAASADKPAEKTKKRPKTTEKKKKG